MSRRALLPAAALALVGAGLVGPPAVLGGGGCHSEATGVVHNDAATSVVRMDVCSFEPTVTRVPVGAEVRFLNTAALDHLVTGRGQSWGSDTLRPGSELAVTFTEAGVFPYSCPLHPGMVGAVVVGDGTPAAAIGQSGAGSAAGTTVGTADDATTEAAGPGVAAGIEPTAAVALGAVSGLLVLGLGALLVRRRPTTDPTTG